MKWLLNLVPNYIIAYNFLVNFHAFRYIILLQYPKVTSMHWQFNKKPRMGEFLEHEGNQTDHWLSLSLKLNLLSITVTSHWCTNLQRLFVLYSDATPAFCTTAFLQKVVKMLQGNCGQITKLHSSPWGTQSGISRKCWSKNTVSCFCNQEDVTIDAFCSR